MHRSKRRTQQVRDTSGTQVCPPIISLLMICHLDHTHELMQALTLSSPRLCHVCTIPNACISLQPVAALMTANGGEISKKAAFSLSASSSSFQVGCREAEHSFISQTNSICKNKTFQCCSVLNPWHLMIKNKTQNPAFSKHCIEGQHSPLHVKTSCCLSCCKMRATVTAEQFPVLGGTEAGEYITTGSSDWELQLARYCRKHPAFSVCASSLLIRSYRNLVTV